MFSLYTFPLGRIIQKYNISYHIYADDTQLYVSFPPGEQDTAVSSRNECIRDIRKWMYNNKLKLNKSKTEFVIMGKQSQVNELSDLNKVNKVGDKLISASKSARNLGVKFDSEFNMRDHVNVISKDVT